MYLVGLTGGMGSGKSTVAARLAEHGCRLVDADAVAREVVEPGEPALAELATHFGEAILADDGRLDRAALARLAFADAAARGLLEAITHPRISTRIDERIAAASSVASGDPPPIVVLDHPLLIETGAIERFDALVVVLADTDVRLHRLAEHRGIDVADARARIDTQASDEQRRAAATHIIVNDDGLDELYAQVDRVYAELRADADEHGRDTRA